MTRFGQFLLFFKEILLSLATRVVRDLQDICCTTYIYIDFWKIQRRIIGKVHKICKNT